MQLFHPARLRRWSRVTIAIAAWHATASLAPFVLAEILAADEVAVFQQPMFVLSPEQFDQWVFNRAGNSTQAISQLESQVTLRIEAIDRVSKLSDDQKRKLQLAGLRDAKRFRDRYEEMKRTYQNTSHPQSDINKIFQEIRPLQAEWQAGVLGDSSLFYKVLRSILEPSQAGSTDQAELERSQFRYKAKIELTIAMLENSLPLTSAQREDLQKLLLAETRPPKQYGQYDYYVVLLQVSKLPENKLQAIFDDAQLRALKQLFQQSIGMEQMLRQQGVLPE